MKYIWKSTTYLTALGSIIWPGALDLENIILDWKPGAHWMGLVGDTFYEEGVELELAMLYLMRYAQTF